MRTILIVDDEKRMRDLLSLHLTPAGYKNIQASSGNEALDYLINHPCDLVLLDVMMPEMDGWQVCTKIREFSEVPIIMLTARTEKPDVIKGLTTGADDYITKPFDSGELLARIEAVFRRMKNTDDSFIDFNGLVWDPEAYTLRYSDKVIPVTPKEFSILGVLLKSQNRVYTREQLLSHIWGQEVETEDRTIDSHIRNIREKLKQAGFPVNDHLTTVWGIGYKWIGEN